MSARAEEEHVITRVSAVALAAAAWVLSLGLAVAALGLRGTGEAGGPPSWAGTVVVLGPALLLAVGAVVASHRHRAWPLAVVALAAPACAVLPLVG